MAQKAGELGWGRRPLVVGCPTVFPDAVSVEVEFGRNLAFANWLDGAGWPRGAVVAGCFGRSLVGRGHVRPNAGYPLALLPSAIGLDLQPSSAAMFEEQLRILLEAGVPENIARVRAEQATRKHLARLGEIG